MAMVRVRMHDELADVIPGKLNKVPGVTHTETHIAFRTYSRHDLDAAFSLGLGAEGGAVRSGGYCTCIAPTAEEVADEPDTDPLVSGRAD